MKRPLLFLVFVCALFCNRTNAQTPFNTVDYINANNIDAAVLVHGDLWYDPSSVSAHCNFPPGSGKNVNFAGSIWMSGYDGSGQLHVSAQTYRQSGNDYWPGPISGGTTISYDSSKKWAKIWKIERSDIQTFQSTLPHDLSNIPEPVLTWPGKGNTYAQGNGGMPLAITNDMAPFIDLNGNGLYEPLAGDYPDVKGDQALWWIFNDNGPVHSASNGIPLGIEVHAMAYAYSRGTLIDDVVYYEYTVINHSPDTFSNFRFGFWDDVELGYNFDDYIGFDSIHRMGIVYNYNNDDGILAGHPPGSYGLYPPMAGMTMIVSPGDVGTSYVPAGSFTGYENGTSYVGDPTTDTQYNYYMRSAWGDGSRFRYNHITHMNTGPECNYTYTGDPSDPSGWSECALNNSPYDMRFVLATGDFTLSPEQNQKIVLALVIADSAGGCGVADFSAIKIVADTAWNIYHHPLPSYPAGIGSLSERGVSVYPNPAHDKLLIKDPNQKNEEVSITVFNTIGQQINIVFDQKSGVLDVSNLPSGVYQLLYKTQSTQRNTTFLKQ